MIFVLAVCASAEWASRDDPIASQFISAVAPNPPCSCDCCSTIERMPTERTPTLDLKCDAPAADQRTDMCPGTCLPSQADAVLTSAETSMDYTRYCQYKCKPATSSVGSMCIRLDARETLSSASTDGNGNPNSPIFGPADTRPTGWADAAASADANRQAAAASADAAQTLSEAGNTKVRYDVQQVMQNRLRAEAAASVSRASAAEARAKADLAAADRAATEAQKQEAVMAFSTAGEEAAVEAQQVAREAAASAQEASRTLAEVQRVAQTVATEASKEAVVQIKQQAAAAAKELADTHAKMWGWDKPAFWPKVESVRAGNPYMAQMTVANQRFAEYKGYSDDEVAAAKGDQAKALGLATQANAMEAQGDRLGAENIRHEIDGLIASQKGHMAKAQSDWNTANTMRLSIPQWQDAGMKASVYAAWKYSNVFTPPPGMFLQKHAGVSPTAVPH